MPSCLPEMDNEYYTDTAVVFGLVYSSTVVQMISNAMAYSIFPIFSSIDDYNEDMLHTKYITNLCFYISLCIFGCRLTLIILYPSIEVFTCFGIDIKL